MSKFFLLLGNRNLEINVQENRVYLIEKIKADRSINPAAKRKEDEVLIYGLKLDIFKEQFADYRAVEVKNGKIINTFKVSQMVIVKNE